MENASRAFLNAVRKSMRQIRSVIGAQQSIPNYSPRPSACDMRLRSPRVTRLSSPRRKAERRSSRLCARPAIGGLVRQVIRGECLMSSGFRRVLSIRTGHGSRINGRPVTETALNFGAVCRRAVAEAPLVLSANGRLTDGGPKRLISKLFAGFHRPERSLVF